MCFSFLFTCSAGANGREDCNFDPPLLFAPFLLHSFGVKRMEKKNTKQALSCVYLNKQFPFSLPLFAEKVAENRKGLRANTVFLAGSKKPRRPYPFEPRGTSSSFLSVVQKGLYLLPMKLGRQEPLPTGSEAARGA